MPNTNYNEIWNILKTIVELIFIDIPIRLTIVKTLQELRKLPFTSYLDLSLLFLRFFRLWSIWLCSFILTFFSNPIFELTADGVKRDFEKTPKFQNAQQSNLGPPAVGWPVLNHIVPL